MPIRRLIIMRHATAAGSGKGTDHDRRLTTRGREEAIHIGSRLRALDAVPDRALSSTAVRCRETFEALCAGMDATPIFDFEATLYNAGPGALLDGVSADTDPGTLLLLAHNPGVSMFAFDLGRGSAEDEDRLRAGFAPATFALFEWDAESSLRARRAARLLHVERPGER
jgi:phosphohistidine phosphatase